MHKHLHCIFCAIIFCTLIAGAAVKMEISDDRVDFYGGYWPSPGTNVTHRSGSGIAITADGVFVNTNAFYTNGVLWTPPVVSPYGPEILSNGDFATGDSTGWNDSYGGGTVVYTAYNASFQGDQVSYQQLLQAGVLTVGKTYHVVFTLVSRTAGTVKVRCGNANSSTYYIPGTYTNDLTCTSFGNFYVQADASFGGVVDDVSVREVLP